jgi:hypothetical protein
LIPTYGFCSYYSCLGRHICVVFPWWRTVHIRVATTSGIVISYVQILSTTSDAWPKPCLSLCALCCYHSYISHYRVFDQLQVLYRYAHLVHVSHNNPTQQPSSDFFFNQVKELRLRETEEFVVRLQSIKRGSQTWTQTVNSFWTSLHSIIHAQSPGHILEVLSFFSLRQAEKSQWCLSLSNLWSWYSLSL